MSNLFIKNVIVSNINEIFQRMVYEFVFMKLYMMVERKPPFLPDKISVLYYELVDNIKNKKNDDEINNLNYLNNHEKQKYKQEIDKLLHDFLNRTLNPKRERKANILLKIYKHFKKIFYASNDILKIFSCENISEITACIINQMIIDVCKVIEEEPGNLIMMVKLKNCYKTPIQSITNFIF